jgi:hypothetical protein
MPRPREREPVPTVQKAGWAPRPVWTAAKNLVPTGIRSPDRPGRRIGRQAYQFFGESCTFHLRGKNINNCSVSRKKSVSDTVQFIGLLRHQKGNAGLNQVAMNSSVKQSRKGLNIRRLFLDAVFITPLFRLPRLAHSHSQKSKSYDSPAYVCQVAVHLPRTKSYHQVSNQT